MAKVIDQVKFRQQSNCIEVSLFSFYVKSFALAMAFIFNVFNLSAQSSEYLTTSGTWVCPAGVTSVTVSCWGAGGGGSRVAGNAGGGGGGGGGAFASSILTVVPGTSYNYVIGNGGNSNINGSASSFNSTTVVAAGGLSAGNNNYIGASGGSVANSTGTIKFAGGNGANGASSFSGGGGGAAGNNGSGTNANGIVGGSGSTLNGGNGGNGISVVQGTGIAGANYGGGGSGGYNTGVGNQNGGPGADGLIVINSNSSIWYNSISGTNPNNANPYSAGDVAASNITVSGIGRGTGITGSNASNRYNANGWSTGAIDHNDYFSFTLTPNSGYKINFTSFSYTGQLSFGTPTFVLRSSVDNYTTNIGAPTSTGTTISLNAPFFQSITSAITFRLYMYNAASGVTFSINDFNFAGSLVSTPSINSFTPSVFCSGTSASLVITGTSFTGATSVNINGLAVASYTVNSSTQITAILNSNNTSGLITIVTPNGTATSTTPLTIESAPVIMCPSNYSSTITVGTCSKSVTTANPTLTGACTVNKLTWSLTGATTANSATTGINYLGTHLFNSGITDVTYTATDAVLHTVTCSFTVTITESVLPAITCPANYSGNTDAGVCTKTFIPAAPVYSDNCSVTTLTWAMTGATTGSSPLTGINLMPSTTFNKGITTITYTLKDLSGNTSTCSYTVTIADMQAPVLSGCPSDFTIGTSSNGTGDCTALLNWNAPAWTDNCPQGAITGMVYLGSYNGNYYYRSTGNHTWNNARTDAALKGGRLVNISSAAENTQITSWISAIPGTHWIGLNDITTEGTYVWDGGAPLTYSNWNGGEPNNLGNEDGGEIYSNGLWNDNRVDLPLASYILEMGLFQTAGSALNGSTVGIGTYNISYNSFAPGGNSTTCSFTINVADNEVPTITCPATQTLSLDASCSATLANYTSLASKSDNCTAAASMVITQSPVAGTTITGSGTMTVTLTATDAAGNTSNCSFIVNKIATTAPSIACPAAQTLLIGNTCSASLPDYTTLATASGSCQSGIVITQSPVAGTVVSGIGTMQIILTATNSFGLSNTCTFNVLKVDNTSPVINCPATQNLALQNNCTVALPNYIPQSSVSDNCTPSNFISLTQNPIAGTLISQTGTTQVVLTATDINGNSSTCIFNVVVTDNSIPTINCPGDQQLILNGSNTATLPDYTSMASATGGCSAGGIISYTQSPVASTILTGSTNQIVTLTAITAQNISASCSFNVSLVNGTLVQFVNSSASANEASGSIVIPISISNPSASNATSFDVVLTSGSSVGINSFISQTFSFAAGSTANQILNISIVNDNICEDGETFVFSLQNISGGYMAAAGSNASFILNLNDDDQQTPVLLSENFDDNDVSNWQFKNTGEWTANATSAINGAFSLKHVTTGNVGKTYASTSLDYQLLNGVETTWRFNFNHFGFDPNSIDKFLFYLSADKKELTEGANGYAVAVYPSNNTEPDWIRLVRLENGAISASIATSTFDLNAVHTKIGIEVVRDAQGMWTLRVDSNGDFDNLGFSVSGSDLTFYEMKNFGVEYDYSTQTSGKLAIDDITISQDVCHTTWYSQSSGNADGVLWAKTLAGTAQAVINDAYSDFVIQSGHTVDFGAYFIAKEIAIENGGVVNANSSKLIVKGNINIQGTFNAQSSTFVICGDQDQYMELGSDAVVGSIEIQNHGNTLHLSDQFDTYIKERAVVTLVSGNLNTHDRIVLKSSAAGSGSIGQISDSYNVVGKVTMQQFVPQLLNYPYGSWVAIGCPVQGPTVADWNDDIITTGFVGSDYPPPYSFNNIQYYEEAIAGNMGNGYFGVTSLNDPLTSERGYFIYMQTPTQALDLKGDIFQHSFDAPAYYHNSGNPGDGWNLLVNQYPSEIDFRQLALNGNGIASAYIYDSESANFKVYNAFAQVGTAPCYIPSNQAFFVKASGEGNYIHYDESYKTNNGVAFEREMPEDAYANFKFKSFNGSSDECVLYFSNDATSGFEWNYDAMKMESATNNAAECALLSTDSLRLTLDARPMSMEEVAIPLYIEMPVIGLYTFEVLSAVNIPFGSCIYVEDLVAGTTIPVEAGQIISINATAAYSGYRLLIHITPPAVVNLTDETCSHSDNGTVEVLVGGDAWNLELLDQSGNLLDSANGSVVFGGIAAGSYQLTLVDSNSVCGVSTMVVEISEPIETNLDILSSQVDVCNNSGNGSIEWIVNNLEGEYQYSLTSSDTAIVAEGNTLSEIILLENLSADNYILSINTSCEVLITEVNIKDPNVVTTSSDSEDVNLMVQEGSTQILNIGQSSLNADWISWSLNSIEESTDPIFAHTFDSEGSFELVLNAGNLFCSASDTMMINVDIVAGIEEFNSSGEVSFIQSNGQSIFTLGKSASEMTTLSILNIEGKVIWTTEVATTEDKKVYVDMSSFASGTYIATATRGNQIELIKKLVI